MSGSSSASGVDPPYRMTVGGTDEPPDVRRHSVAGRSILEAIGRTPAVELNRLTAGIPGRIVAKLEYLNPGLSKKDRVALAIVRDAEAAGELRPGQPVVELTSGNTGTGLAIVCAVTGHPFTAVMSAGNSSERVRMMRALGAKVVLVAQTGGSRRGSVSGGDLALVDKVTEELARSLGAFRADQFHRRANVRAHEALADELLMQAEGEIDAFCDFVGTGGTFAGVSTSLRRRLPSVCCYVLEPDGAAVLSGQEPTDPRHRIQGGGYGIADLALMQGLRVDGYLTVSDKEAIAMARLLAKIEGIMGGFSAGAVVAAAIKLLRERHRGGSIAVVIADSGVKYLSTDLWLAEGGTKGAARPAGRGRHVDARSPSGSRPVPAQRASQR